MKKIFFPIVAIATTVTIFSFINKNQKADGEAYKVLADYSKIEWVGSKKSGYHTGTFSLKSGEVWVKNGKLTGGKFTIDLTSVKVIGEGVEKLENHLKTKDFFDVTNFTEATYEITDVKYADNDNSNCNITGNFTLKGITVPLTFKAAIRNADDKKFFGQAYFSIDRTLWGINFGSGMIANDVQIAVHLFANK